MVPAVEMYSISKRFGPVIANDKINLTVYKGEIHAIVGENGAGKTTLMNILYGLLQPDEGEIYIYRKKVRFHRPLDAIRYGIGMVHQHFKLIPPFTVAENVVLGAEPVRNYFFLDHLKAFERVKELSEIYSLHITPFSKVSALSVGLQQRVELIKVLYRAADVLILDEPTSVLTPHEINELFNIIKSFVKKGKTIIFITHKLNEVMAIADRVTIIKNGKVVKVTETANTSLSEIAKLMVGKEIEFENTRVALRKEIKNFDSRSVILEVKNVNALNDRRIPALKNVSFSVCRGEILGIAGVEGNGQTELVEVLTGLRKIISGTILFDGNLITNFDTSEIRKLKIGWIPDDRMNSGLVSDYTIEDNLILGRHKERKFTKFFNFLLNRKQIQKNALLLINEYDIRPANPNLPVGILSGGNQQKIILARELSMSPSLLICVHPTRGLDISATQFVHQKIIEQRNKGTAILLVSSDLSEILSLSDRIAVMYNGEIVSIVEAEKTNEMELGFMMTGGHSN